MRVLQKPISIPQLVNAVVESSKDVMGYLDRAHFYAAAGEDPVMKEKIDTVLRLNKGNAILEGPRYMVKMFLQLLVPHVVKEEMATRKFKLIQELGL